MLPIQLAIYEHQVHAQGTPRLQTFTWMPAICKVEHLWTERCLQLSTLPSADLASDAPETTTTAVATATAVVVGLAAATTARTTTATATAVVVAAASGTTAKATTAATASGLSSPAGAPAPLQDAEKLKSKKSKKNKLRGKKVIHADLPVETECSESHPSVSAPSAPSGEEGAASEPSVVELDAEPKTGEPLPNTAAEIASDERISEALRAESQEEEEEPEVPPETPEVLEAPKVLEVPEKTPETPDLVLEAPEKCQAAKIAKKQAAKVRLQAAAKVVNDVGVVGRPEAPAPSAVAAATAAAKQQPLRPPPKNSPQLRPVPVAAQPPPKVGGGGGGGAPGGPPV
ncbi:unnamed protein product, partial [Polarella glacialis]